MQYKALAVDKIHSLSTTLSKMADKNDDFIMKESCKSFSVF